uniref:Uncharacterized protein n=1 Tax=Romanomermis culicivorax TaxID=13658 RepID=A0A915IP02_ROMCU
MESRLELNFFNNAENQDEKEVAEEKLKNQIKDNEATRESYEKMLREMLEKDHIIESITKELNDAKRATSSLLLQTVSSEHLDKVKDEISRLRVSHKIAIEKEHLKVDKIRKEFLDVRQTHEDALKILERKLTEMTLVISEKEKESSSLREKIRSLEHNEKRQSESNNHEISNLRQTVSILKDRMQTMQMEHENQLLSQSAKIDELNRSYRTLEGFFFIVGCDLYPCWDGRYAPAYVAPLRSTLSLGLKAYLYLLFLAERNEMQSNKSMIRGRATVYLDKITRIKFHVKVGFSYVRMIRCRPGGRLCRLAEFNLKY